MANERFYGSICLTDLIEFAKKKHSAFTKSENGKFYASVNVWLNEEVDKYGNIMSMQLNPSKENKDTEERPYIGNMKKSQPKSVSDRDISNLDVDLDAPIAKKNQTASDISKPIDDLPF